MIRFYVAQHRFDAYLVADRLNQAGIKAHVFNEHASSIVGDVPPDVAQPQVWLARDADRERATILLRTIEAEAARGGTLAVRRMWRGVARQFRALLEVRPVALIPVGAELCYDRAPYDDTALEASR